MIAVGFLSEQKYHFHVLLGSLYAMGAQGEVTFGLVSNQTNNTVAELTVDGQLSLFSLYQPENDIPSQRAALENLYYKTAGQDWSAGAYFSTAFLDAAEEFALDYANNSGTLVQTHLICVYTTQFIPMRTLRSSCSASAGTVYVDFSTFVDVMLLKVPWFTPGFSYCRWWGVECCLTASDSSLPSCTEGLQSVGALALAGQP